MSTSSALTTPRATHHAVLIEGRRTAVPFTFFNPAYALAKRATRDGNPAQVVEVYEKDGKHFDVNGQEVLLRVSA
jgi:hypothetical protein